MKKFKTAVCVMKSLNNFHLYFQDYLGLLRKPVIYSFRNGVKLKVRGGTTDRAIINEVWIHNSYTPKGFELRERDVVLDIGGHIGIFSILASKCAKEGRVYVFEPFPENFNLLKENVELNNARNVNVVNKAVSKNSGKNEFFVSSDNNRGENSLFSSAGGSIKDFVKKEKIEKIDFLKMDCEGAEYEILYGLSRSELEKIGKISLEYHNIDKKRNGLELKKFLEKNGFKVRIDKGRRRGMIYASFN
jgi:FkbM family methyltransferase